MDGGGRLSRPVKQPQRRSDPAKTKRAASRASKARVSDLKPTLLPEPAFTARDFNDQHRNGLIATLERWLPRGVGTGATFALLFCAGVLGVMKGGYADDVTGALSDTRNAMANAAGFRITSVAITGRKQLTQDEILAVGGVNGRSSLLFLDAATMRERLQADPWIREATVQKLYPGRLQIEITERAPFALWQQDGKLSVISEDGTVLEPYVARRFVNLPLVVGKGAETRARDFLDLIAQYPQISSSVKAIVFVGERRWNLRLANGLDVRLPENGVDKALATLSRLDSEEQLFSRDITAIDMRLPDRLTVRLSEDAAKARMDAINAAKPKRKAGDA
ncbi:MAG: cell division protein FtsQ/DivIB [Bradyrhizobiaceae bacterium]|nr:MAG: cell division protein FtsQ/DivIB [Bradyrhizobiaceae bacterium]